VKTNEPAAVAREAASASRDPAPGAASVSPPLPSEPSRTCPNCGAALFEQKCKLLCPNRSCGYYLSCSDFY